MNTKVRSCKLYLCLVVHNHQPVGNQERTHRTLGLVFDFVFEEAFAQAYDPLVAALEPPPTPAKSRRGQAAGEGRRHAGVRLTMHWSGPVRDWLEEHRPEFLRRVRVLVGRKH